MVIILGIQTLRLLLIFSYKADLTRMVISYIYETSMRRVSYISYKLTTSVRFCLSYDHLNGFFMACKMKIISISKHIVDMDVVNDITFKMKTHRLHDIINESMTLRVCVKLLNLRNNFSLPVNGR